MRTIFYFDTYRNYKKIVRIMIAPLLFIVFLCIICELVDLIAPQFNDKWMRWPGYIKTILCMSSWSSALAGNLFQIFYLVYPAYLYYQLMNGLCDSVLQDRFTHTDIFVRNMGINGVEYGICQFVYWLGIAFVSIISMMVVQLCMVGLFQIIVNVADVLMYYSVLLIISFLYLSIAWFVSSYVVDVRKIRIIINLVVFGFVILSRCPAILYFFNEIVVALGGNNGLERISRRIAGLEMMAPLLWGCGMIHVNAYCVACTIIIFIVMSLSTVSIYKEW